MTKRIVMTLFATVMLVGLMASAAFALDNANGTGSGVDVNDGTTRNQVIKSTMGDGTTQRTHGEYQNNTNSCASCHQTHTAEGKSLLFKSGVYTTCTACHDGTLGFYNVFEGSTAGTFGGDPDGNPSMHIANSTVAIKAAPGGNATGTGTWAGEFNCASCHAPHGSYSDRLLHYNPNGMGQEPAENGGIQATGNVIAKADLPAASGGPKNAIVKDSPGNLGITAPSDMVADSKMIAVFDNTGSAYALSTKPWLYGYAGKPKVYWTSFKDGSGVVVLDYEKQEATGVTIKFDKGYAYATTADGAAVIESIATGQASRVYVVKLDLVETGEFYGDRPVYTVNQSALYAGTKIGTLADSNLKNLGVAMSTFCSACHTDYMAKSSSSTGIKSGTFSQAYRHSTTSDSYTCVRCHFSHGTDVTIMKDAHGDTVADLVATGETLADAKEYMLDVNPSSALKRFTNMSVCWACHTSSKATQLKNNEYYQTNDNAPHGLPAGN